MNSAIRHFSTTSNSKYFLAAEVEETVYLYEKGKKDHILCINTHLDFGGDRLQILPKNKLIISGAYNIYGIEAYCLVTGELIWKRKDLKKVQRICRHPQSNYLSCFFEGSAGQVLNKKTGETIRKYRGVKKVFFDNTEEFSLEAGRVYNIKRKDVSQFKVKPESFALMDVAFSNKLVALTESGADFRLISLESGCEVARYAPPKGYHILSIEYFEQLSRFVCLLYGYESAGDYFLLHVSEEGGITKKLIVNDGYATAFFEDRQSLIIASGKEIDCITGQEIFSYNFKSK